MDKTENSQNRYATPYNVDLNLSSGKNYFSEYIKRVISLPVPIKNILTDFSTAEFVEERLATAFGLSEDQKTNITRIIRDVLLGDLSPNAMLGSISQKLGLNRDPAQKLQDTIVRELFAPAIEDIKKNQKTLMREADDPRQAAPLRNKPDLKIDPGINRNNIIDLRNRNNQ